MNKSTFTAELRIKALIDDAQKELTTFGNSLKSAWANGNPPKNMLRTYEEMRVRLESLKQLAKKGIVDTSDLRQAENDYKAFQKDIHNLSVEFRLFTNEQKRAMLSTEEQANLRARAEAVRQYNEVLKKNQEILKKREPLEKQKEEIKQSQTSTRALATTQLEDSQSRLKKLKERGPATQTMSPEAQAYAKTLERQQVLLDEIEQAQKRINILKSKGLKEGGKNQLTEARAELEKLIKEQEAFSAMAGKSEYDTAIKAYNDEITSLELTISSATETLAVLNSAFENIDSQLEELSLQDTEKGLEKLKQRLKELGVEGVDDAEDFETLRAKVQELENQALSRVDGSIKKVTKGLSVMGDQAKEVGKEIDQTTEAIKRQDEAASQRKAFEDKIKSLLGLSGAAQLLRSALRDAMQTITELDATMTEMAVVTDLTVGDYWNQLPEYSKQASDLGVSINSAYKAATLYYQQGLKGNEVTKISAETLKMAKIAGLDAADATNKMTAALRGFNMELNETSAQRVSDVYSELAAITAADVDEISNAMTKTASIAHSAGMEFETTAAFLSQIIETTRESAETAGTALKTVIARFQELKKDPAEIGEVDGEIVDANKIETALRSVGVALRDSSGQFRELDDVFLELSGKWDGLDKNTQRYIATIAAGSRQQSRFIAMMSDYGRTQELVTAANNSAGASQRQFEKTLEGVEAKLEKLKNAWHEFTMGIMNSDLVKTGIDILTKFLEILNKMTDGIGEKGFGGGLMKLFTIFGVFKMGMAIFKKFEAPLSRFFQKIVEMAGIAGHDSGKKFTEEAKRGSQEAEVNKNSQKETNEQQKKQNAGQFIKDKSGYSSFKKGVDAFSERNAARDKLSKMDAEGGRLARENRVEQAKQRVATASKAKGSKTKGSPQAKEWKAAQDELKQAKIDLEEYDKTQQTVKEKSSEAWQSIGQGVSQAGQALTGIGMGMAAVGGIMSSLGLEEFGDTLASIGSVITMIGTALMAIPPILTLITAHPIIALITLIVGVILGTIIAIISYINSISAEAQLAEAQKNAEAAREAAEMADQAFKDLNQSLADLDSKYDTLDNLREGTEEWNKAVQDVNASVLELIDKYPELAGLVENEGGVLKLDIESDEVQDVIKKYESSAASAKAVQYSAEAKVTEARQMVEFSNLDAVNEVSKLRGGKAFGTAVGSGAATGAATLGTAGAIAGGGIFSGILGGLGAIFGGIGGAIVGAIGGAIAGPIENAATHTDEELKKATEALALSVQEGATDTDFDSMKDFLIAQGVAADEAEVLAESFAMDTEALLEFGEATQASKAAIEAQYSAMAMQAKQMINLGAYSAQDQEQMSNIVDAEKMKALEDARAAEIAKEYEDKSNTDEFDQMKEDFAKEQFGAGARVDGNQILDEKGEVIREFEDDEEFAQAMAAAQATKEAADAMKKIPGIINTSAGYFENKVKGAGQSFEDLFTGKDGNNLTQQDIENLQEATNNGALDKAWENLSEEERKVYGTQEEFNKEFNERLNKASESLKKSQDRLTEVNKTLVLNKKLTADAADAWVKNLEQMKIGGASDAEITNVSTELDKVLQGLTEEQAATAMAQINAIDQMDIASWEGLADTFEELGLMTNINKEALDGFIKSGIEASNAIRKINFDTLANDINDTFKLLDKIKEGGRTYSESDYKELIAANKALEKSFMQVGDEFIYMGGSMDELTDAVKKNTLAQLGEANRQLQSRQGMANIIDSSSNSYGSVEYMNEYQAMSYLTEMRSKFQSEGFNIEDFGIQGLSNNTDFSKATAEQLKDWAVALASEGNKTSIYSQDYAEGLRKANIQNFSHNDATYNAQMAATEGEYADEHQEALILQAIQSGAVNNSIIESYKEAIKENNTAQIKSIGEQIAKDIDKVVEQSEGREAFNNLVDRVAKAIEDASRKEIDKLSQLYDAMNNANTQLISKIQEQINEDRAKREQEKAEKNLANLQSQQAYLMMDTSGMNTLESQALTENIADAEQQLQDSLIDQSLQNLQDANDAAAQQRERQIMLAEQQLENDIESGRIMEESTAIVTESIEALKDGTSIDKTTMGEILKEELADSQDMSDTITEATKAANWAGEQLPKPTNTGALVTERSEAEKKADEEAAKKAENQQKTKNALATGKNILESVAKGGFASQDVEGSELDKAFKDYNAAANAYNATITDQSQKMAVYSSREEFAKATGVSNIRQHDFKDIGYINYEGNNFDFADALTEEDWGEVTLNNGTEANLSIKGTNSTAATAASARGLADGRIFKYSGGYYIYKDGQAYTVMSDKRDYDSLKAYAGGGLADFTGPAWLDGTKSRPEYVLNSAQTERFFSLIDVLERYDADDTKKSSGDNYFEIEINVEKLENDYDVEQVANKIRKMIYEDAMYRNVNAINNMR